MTTTPSFESFALIELFGHSKLAGKCSEQNVAGTNFLRVDVPETKNNPAFTRLLNHAAIYAINPITEDVAKAMAERIEAQPITAWDVKEYQKKQNALLIEAQSQQSIDAKSDELEEEEEQYLEREDDN